MRAFIQIFFIGIASISYGQNAKLYSIILNVCSIKLNDSTNAYISKEKIMENSFLLFVKTQNTIIDKECTENELKNKTGFLNTNNPLIYFNEKKLFVNTRINDIETSIPQKLWYQKNRNNLYLCIELSNFSTTSVGNGFTYLILTFYKKTLKKSQSIERRYPFTKNEVQLFLKKQQVIK
jgi:hypothetical protein